MSADTKSRTDDMEIRIPDVCLAVAGLDRALPPLDRVDGLEQYFMSLGQVSTVAYPRAGLLANPAQRDPDTLTFLLLSNPAST